MRPAPLTAALALALALAALAAPATAQPARSLDEQVAAADAAFFGALFDRCDPEALAPMVADDLEFFHDKWGRIAKSKDEFLAAIRGMCERQRAGTDFKARRELVPGSSAVFPMKGVGAFQTGRHRFFRVAAGKPDEPTESARFAHLWRQDGERWQLARVYSYDHVDAPSGRARE